jgi:hypothetical protein
VFWVIFSAAAVVVLAASTHRLARGREELRPLAVLAATVCVAISGVMAAASLALSKLTCDESCFGSGWTHDPDAWQWKALPVLAIAGFAATAFAAGLLGSGRYSASLRALAVGVACFTPFAWLVLEFG